MAWWDEELSEAEVLICPIDGTAARPPISFGGDGPRGNSGTGIYGDISQVNLSVGGTKALGVDANGVCLGGSVYFLRGSGAPVDGTTGDNVAGPGSLYVDIATGDLYAQTAVITSPVWVLVSSQT